jgi:hypothetical protein
VKPVAPESDGFGCGTKRGPVSCATQTSQQHEPMLGFAQTHVGRETIALQKQVGFQKTHAYP